MATLRNIAISLLHLAGITQMNRTLQAVSRNPGRALGLIPLEAGTYQTLPIPGRRPAMSSEFAAFRARRVRGRSNFHSILFETA
jgi:hypothetical protein